MALIVKNDTLAISLALCIFMIISILLYLNVDSNSKKYSNGILLDGVSVVNINELRIRLKTLHLKAENNKKFLEKITDRFTKVNQNIQHSMRSEKTSENEIRTAQQNVQRSQITVPFGKKYALCGSGNLLHFNASVDVQMLNIYDRLPFDNQNGGTWKQGWAIKYNPIKIRQEKKLEVIVIPHSHNDPGWLKTFESYFEEQTKQILDLMIVYLNKKRDMKFIYAEMSFFELWWSQQTFDIKEQVKKFLTNGQLEIVTGGWVMTDEANAHYYSTIMELIEGHEFLQNHLGFIPANHWSIDPFGLSPTLAYILNQANLTHMAVQRVHYSVKKYLAQTKQLEFKWRQLFADNDRTDIITHMFPFYSYDVPHSCGPNPMVCCQFDFRRLHGGKMNCPWGRNPIPITQENVAERAELLADQYRKKAQLYAFNTILVPLGDDFRYDIDAEWLDQYSNYKLLFDYMNAKEEWNINARFGTLADYFTLFNDRLDQSNDERTQNRKERLFRHIAKESQMDKSLPILSGDFFTYSDRDDHYWSGYFTSRPYYKHMDRSLQHLLRTADIFYSLTNWQKQLPSYMKDLYNQLVSARRSMSLFQHHDGVTGTARTEVMTDYGEKMARALDDSKRIIALSVQSLLNMTTSNELNKEIFRVDEEHFINRLPEKLIIADGSMITVINSLGQSRKEVICIYVDNLRSRIYQETGIKIPQQIQPIFYINSENNIAFFHEKFELCFLASLPAYGIIRFNIIKSYDSSHKVKVYMSDEIFNSSEFEVEGLSKEKDIKISNEYITARFDPTSGFLKSIQNRQGNNVNITASFVRYGARSKNPARRDGGDSLSGAYLFLPDGPARELASQGNSFIIMRGPIRQYIFVRASFDVDLYHRIALDINSEFLSLWNIVNLAKNRNVYDSEKRKQKTDLGNYELAMRIQVSSIKGDNFYTDLNGFQMIRRRRHLNKLPIQAHFYPMPGSAFIEDANFRISLIGRQALGVASLKSGEMQVMLDRRLIQDDDRGLGQKIDDNLLTESHFRLYVEQFTKTRKDKNYGETNTIGFPSLAAHHASLQLNYPPVVLFAQSDSSRITSGIKNIFAGLENPFPCDIHPVIFRTLSNPTIYGNVNGSMTSKNTMPKREAALVLHRIAFDCTLMTTVPESSCLLKNADLNGKIHLGKLFFNSPRSIRNVSLTLLHYAETQNDIRKAEIIMNPMDLKTVKIEF